MLKTQCLLLPGPRPIRTSTLPFTTPTTARPQRTSAGMLVQGRSTLLQAARTDNFIKGAFTGLATTRGPGGGLNSARVTGGLREGTTGFQGARTTPSGAQVVGRTDRLGFPLGGQTGRTTAFPGKAGGANSRGYPTGNFLTTRFGNGLFGRTFAVLDADAHPAGPGVSGGIGQTPAHCRQQVTIDAAVSVEDVHTTYLFTGLYCDLWHTK